MHHKRRLLDLFSGEGGAATGYHRAGFAEIVGVDINPQPLYPFDFDQADAMSYPLDGFDAVTGSPPCYGHSDLAALNGGLGQHETTWMLEATLARFRAELGDVPWVVENSARAKPIQGELMLCGSEFGLFDGPYLLRRHRRFASNVFLVGAGGCAHGRHPVIGVYGELSKNDRRAVNVRRVDERPHGDMRAGLDRARRIMGMPWASERGVTNAIPPAYTEHIGRQLLEHLDRQARRAQ